MEAFILSLGVTKQYQMQISKQTLELIYDLKEWGDKSKIAKLANTSDTNIHNALKKGRGSEEIVTAIISFYESVKADRLELKNRINQL
jgi:putative Ca2+/H+ antiporter (TMEM165/GDT1 family)